MISRTARENLAGWLWVSPWIVGFLAFFAAPAVMSLYFSFTDYPLIEPPVWVGGENYRRLASDPVFWRSLGNMGLYALMFLPLSLLLSLGTAWLVAREGRGVRLCRTAIVVPTLVPLVATAMIWYWLFNGRFGPINRLLRLIGLEGPNWLLDGRWALPALVLMGLWSIGQTVMIYVAALKNVPDSLHEAAAIDGLGALGRFRHVTLPAISPVVLFNVVVTLIGTFQVFAAPYIMTKGGPDRATYLVTQYLYDCAFPYQQMGYACAIGWIEFLVVLALTGVLMLAGRRHVYYRGL